MDTKILVTGGAGFIGSNLVRYLLNQGVSVVNVDKLTYAGNPESLRDLAGNANYAFEQVDICDQSAVAEVFAKHRPQRVMHLAAESHVDRSIDSPGEFIQTNVVGTYNLLKVALDHYRSLEGETQDGFRFLHVSTDEVYGSLAMDDPAFSETTRYDPHSPYSASKASSDHLVRAWGDTFGLPILITNCSNNYGPYQFPEKLIPVVILKAMKGDPIPVYGKGENIRDWLYVEDHASALYTVLERGRCGETYNIGGDNELRNLDLVRHLCEILDELKPSPSGKRYAEQIEFTRDRPGHDLRYAIDARKIREELGWSPSADGVTGFRRTIEWYFANEDWWRAILEGTYQLDRLGNG